MCVALSVSPIVFDTFYQISMENWTKKKTRKQLRKCVRAPFQFDPRNALCFAFKQSLYSIWAFLSIIFLRTECNQLWNIINIVRSNSTPAKCARINYHKMERVPIDSATRVELLNIFDRVQRVFWIQIEQRSIYHSMCHGITSATDLIVRNNEKFKWYIVNVFYVFVYGSRCLIKRNGFSSVYSLMINLYHSFHVIIGICDVYGSCLALVQVKEFKDIYITSHSYKRSEVKIGLKSFKH